MDKSGKGKRKSVEFRNIGDEPHHSRRTQDQPEIVPVMENVLEEEEEMPGRPQCLVPRDDHGAMSTRQYLNNTVAPVLLAGMQAVARERPQDPLMFMAAFILKNSPNPPTS